MKIKLRQYLNEKSACGSGTIKTENGYGRPCDGAAQDHQGGRSGRSVGKITGERSLDQLGGEVIEWG